MVGALLVVWVTLSVFRACCTACEFPAFLQTNSSADGHWRDWRGQVRQQHMDAGLRITVSTEVLSLESTEDPTTSYVLHCVEVLPADDQEDAERFLVRRVDNVVSSLPYYTCVQFVRRSPDVVQVRATPLSDRRPDSTICHTWQLDPWIWIDRAAAVPRRGLPCPLRGGFTIRMHDRTGSQGACDSRRGEVRMEADCEHLAEGTHFYFRHTTCIPLGLYMYATQRTLCVANWTVGAYTFTLLRHDRLSYAWLLRFPTKPEDSFTAYLLSDLVADPAEYVAATTNYIRLDTVRNVPRPATSLCVDEHNDACAAWRNPCTSGPQTALACARTCGVCNATRPVICSFPPELVGHWYGGGDDVVVEFQKTSLELKSVSGSRLSTLRCVRWQPPPAKRSKVDRFRYITDEMLVAEYGDGCQPRYVCARMLRKSTSVIYLRLSAARTWPLTSSPAEPIDCHSFSFDHVDDDVASNALQIKHFRLLFSRESRGDATPCRLPSHALNNYSVVFRDGVDCVGSVSESNLGSTTLRMTLTSCSPAVNRTQYSFQCRESSRLPPSNDLVVVVSSNPSDNRTVYHCWLFPVAVGVFYLFDARQCDAVMRGVKPSVPAGGGGELFQAGQLVVDELTPLAVFSSKFRRTPREEDDDQETVASPASRVQHMSKSSADGKRRVIAAYSNTSVPSSSSSSPARTSPSVLDVDRASLASGPFVISTTSISIIVVHSLCIS